MKLLLENWRQYLNERETDELYSRFVGFFVDVYSDGRNFEFESEEERFEYEGEDGDIDYTALAAFFNSHPHLTGKVEVGKDALKEYTLLLITPRAEEIVQKILEMDPEGKLFSPNIGSEGYWLPSIEIKFDKDSGSMGSWNASEQELTLYFDSMMGEDEYKQISNADDIRKIMRTSDYKSLLMRVLNHELTHFINSVRAESSGEGPMAKNYWKTKEGKRIFQYVKDNFKNWKSWGEKNGYSVEKMVRYINSTEEIQARLIPIFKEIQNFVNSPEEADTEARSDDFNFIRVEIKKEKPDVQKIIKYMKNIYALEHPHYWELTTRPLQNKILQRFYQFALQFIGEGSPR